MSHLKQIVAQHISAIQRQIDILDNYLKTTPATQQQKNTATIRRKIYTDLLSGAATIYEAAQLQESEINNLRASNSINRSIRILDETRPTAANFAAWKANYLMKNKRPALMDFNTSHTI